MRRQVIAKLVCVAMVGLGCVVPGDAAALGRGRAYELVTPTYKAGYGATHVDAVSLDGNSIAYYSQGVFAGAPANDISTADTTNYAACRGEDGWTSYSMLPPVAQMPLVMGAADVNPTLSAVLLLGKPGATTGLASFVGTQNMFLQHMPCAPDTGEWEMVGKVLETAPPSFLDLAYRGASFDFCHIFFDNPGNDPYGLLPGADNTDEQLYEWNRGCDEEQSGLRLVGVTNEGPEGKVISANCPVIAGTIGASANGFNAVADGGREVFFTTCVFGEPPQFDQLFVRLGGARTIEISKPLGEICNAIPCPNARGREKPQFAGAAEDGSKVYFTSRVPLTNEGADQSDSLYMAEIGCPQSEPECAVGNRTVTKVVRVSANPRKTEQSAVQGVVRVAPDGSRVYFVAEGDLLPEAEQAMLEHEGRSVPAGGADNLYEYDAKAGAVSFIADLCSGPGRSGGVEDASCPETGEVDDAPLWATRAGAEAQTSGSDGRYLVFSTYARLTSNDANQSKDVYRYDSVSNRLERISVGEDGFDANGNEVEADATIAGDHVGESVAFQSEVEDRAVTTDGSRIVFKSAAPLSPAAINGIRNVYEWHEGEGVSLVSTGSAEAPVEDVVISGTGNDIFFDTSQGIVPRDKDGAPDVYDARVGGGFPEEATSVHPCESDGCQSIVTAPAPVIVPGSATQEAGDNVAIPRAAHHKVRAKRKVRKGTRPKARRRKRRAKKK